MPLRMGLSGRCCKGETVAGLAVHAIACIDIRPGDTGHRPAAGPALLRIRAALLLAVDAHILPKVSERIELLHAKNLRFII